MLYTDFHFIWCLLIVYSDHEDSSVPAHAQISVRRSIQTLYLNLHCIQQPGRRFIKLLKDKDGLKETFAFMR